jgi:hypothetical protein
VKFRRHPAAIVPEKSRVDQTKAVTHPHVTDEYIQEFGKKQGKFTNLFIGKM